MMNVVLGLQPAPHQPQRAAVPGPRWDRDLGRLHVGRAAREGRSVVHVAGSAGSGLMAAVVCVILGFPFSRLKGIYFTMITIFFVQVIILTVQQWRSVTGGASGLQGVPRPDSFLGLQFHSKTSFYFLFLALMVVSLLILWAIEHSRVGLTFQGIQQADSLAEERGHQHHGYKVLAFAIGGFFAGLMGGALRAVRLGCRPDGVRLSAHHLHLDLRDRGWRGQLHRARHRRHTPHRATRGGPAAQELDAGALRGDPHAHHLPHARRAGGTAAEDPEGCSRRRTREQSDAAG